MSDPSPSSSSELPPPLRGSDPDSFAHRTVTERWPRIAHQMLADNDFSASVEDRIRRLIDEIPEGPIRPIDDPQAPDSRLWKRYVEEYEGRNWLTVPWLFGEHYFYRRIVAATGYLSPGLGRGADPFGSPKRESLDDSRTAIRKLIDRTAEAPRERSEILRWTERLILSALWGNQADLSLFRVGDERPDHLTSGVGGRHLLVDDVETTVRYLDELAHGARVELLADNAGMELVADLVLADGLLRTGMAESVTVHLKAHPTFVSDATAADLFGILQVLEADPREAVRGLARRCRRHLSTGGLRLEDGFVWTSPLPFREIPEDTLAELGRSDLVVSKGDAHYRRLLGDRHWAFTRPFEDVTAYFPAPLLALRTLKAEVVCGLDEDQVDAVRQEDPDWLVDGRWGVAQAHIPD